MAKETGFANFSPEQAEAFRQEQQHTQPQDPYAGTKQEKTKDKQKDQSKWGDKMDEVTKKNLPQQGSSKSRKTKGLEKDPGLEDTQLKKHLKKASQNNDNNG